MFKREDTLKLGTLTSSTPTITETKYETQSVEYAKMSTPESPLDIPELLAEVFSTLSLRDLNNARQVCHYWNNTVQSAPTLRFNRFLTPVPVTRKLIWKDGRRGAKAVPHIVEPDEVPEGSMGLTIAAVHPALLLERRTNPFQIEIRFDFPSLGCMLSWSENAEFLDSFLTQPPCQMIHVHCFFPPLDSAIQCIFDPNGVRLRAVVERLQEIPSEFRELITSGRRPEWYRKPVKGAVRGYIAYESKAVRRAERLLVKQRKTEETGAKEVGEKVRQTTTKAKQATRKAKRTRKGPVQVRRRDARGRFA